MPTLRKTPNDTLAIKFSAAKEALRIEPEFTLEDNLIKRLIRAASTGIENIVHFNLMDTEYSYTGIAAEKEDLIFIMPELVQEIEVTNAEFFVVGEILTVTASTAGTVTVNLTAGMAAEAEEIPFDLQEAVTEYVIHMYENRANALNGLPDIVEQLVQPHKRYV